MFREPYELSEEELKFIEGYCPDWVRENYKEGDMIFCILDYNVGCFGSGLTHCFLKRGDLFCDIRGETNNINKFMDMFNMYQNHRKIECFENLNDFESCIKKCETLRYETSKLLR